MPAVRCDLEFDYVGTGPQGLNPSETITYEYTAPTGWSLVGWGFEGVSSDVRLDRACILRDANGVPTFYAAATNLDAVNQHSIRFRFALVKL